MQSSSDNPPAQPPQEIHPEKPGRAPLTRRDRQLLVLGALAVMLVCILLNRTVIGSVPHGWDDASYYFQGQVFAGGRVTAPGTPMIDLFWVANVVNRSNARFAKYPPGWPALLAPAVLIRAPEVANALLAAACAVFAALVAARLFGRREALLVIALALLSPFFMFMGSNYLAHMACASALSALLYLMLRTTDTIRHRDTFLWGIAVGVAATVAFLARPYSAVLGGVGAAGIVLLAVQWNFRRWIMMTLGACIPLVLGAASFLAYNTGTTGSPLVTGYELYEQHLSFAGTALDQNPSLWLNMKKYLPQIVVALNHSIWGWPFLPDLWLLIAAVALNLRNRRAWGFFLAVVFYVLGHSIYYYFDVYFGPRLVFETMPWILIGSAVGVVSIWDRSRGFPRPGRMALLVPAVLLTGWAIYFFVDRARYYSLSYCGQGQEVLETAGVGELENALVFVRGDPYVYANFFFLNALDLKRSPVLFARYSSDRMAEAMARYPREKTLILDVEYEPLMGPDGYADRFILKEAQWTEVGRGNLQDGK